MVRVNSNSGGETDSRWKGWGECARTHTNTQHEGGCRSVEGKREAPSKFWSIDPTFNRINEGRKRNFVDEHPIRFDKMPGFLGNMFTLLFLMLIRFAKDTEISLELNRSSFYIDVHVFFVLMHII